MLAGTDAGMIIIVVVVVVSWNDGMDAGALERRNDGMILLLLLLLKNWVNIHENLLGHRCFDD
jgi:hypothetical protein